MAGGPRYGDGSDGELPPDPWAGLAATPPHRPDGVPSADRGSSPTARGQRPGDGPAQAWHPAGQDQPSAGAPTSPRGLLGHPVVWVVITIVALLALVTAALDRPAAPPSEPTPGTVSTAPAEPTLLRGGRAL